MTRAFRDLPLRRKLLWMSLAASATTLVLAIVGFLAWDAVTFREAMIRKLSVQADIIGSNAASAIVFSDPEAARETLRALEAEPQIVAARLYGADGETFARFARGRLREAPVLPDRIELGTDGQRVLEGDMILFRPIRVRDRLVGTVALEADMAELTARVLRGFGIGAALLVVGLFTALGISAVLERVTSRPILELALTARRVSEERDYSIRAQPGGRDEVGVLIDSVNEMLGEIEKRDEALRKTHAELETRVGERTAELRSEVGERTRAQKELALRAEELARSNHELEQFAYVASHDLQEPLRTVSSYVQLLARRYRGKLDQDADDFIEFAVDGAQRMQELIQDLLQYSRVGTRGKELEPVESGEVLERVLQGLAEIVRERGARITHGPLPRVLADDSQLVQLFQNLVTNALKFCDASTPEVHVSAERENDLWHFSVRDNGIGIDPRFAEKIFVIFQRLHTREKYSGTGIGLAVCKKIVERHGGRIWVESEEGKGATFHFTLVAAPGAEARDEDGKEALSA